MAEWLVIYDKAAWYSTDELMKQDKEKLEGLGRHWFCFQDSLDVWHSVYGNYEDGSYEQMFHFIIKSREDVSLSDEKIDQDLLNAYGMALDRAFNEMEKKLPYPTVRFNHYIRQEGSGNFSVFIFPAFQPDGTVLYGAELVFEISPEDEILQDLSYIKEGLYQFTIDTSKEIILNYTELDRPTLGAVFFAVYYKDYFKMIKIDDSKSVSFLMNSNGTYSWIHIEKEGEQEKPEEPVIKETPVEEVKKKEKKNRRFKLRKE